MQPEKRKAPFGQGVKNLCSVFLQDEQGIHIMNHLETIYGFLYLSTCICTAFFWKDTQQPGHRKLGDRGRGRFPAAYPAGRQNCEPHQCVPGLTRLGGPEAQQHPHLYSRSCRISTGSRPRGFWMGVMRLCFWCSGTIGAGWAG